MKTTREIVVLAVSGCAIIACIGTLVTVGVIYYWNKPPHESAELPRKREALDSEDVVAKEKARMEAEARRQKEEAEQQEANRRSQESSAMVAVTAELDLISKETPKFDAKDFQTFVTNLHNLYSRLAAVDTIKCPKDFRDAYADYCKALDSAYDSASKIPPSTATRILDSIGKMYVEKKWKPGFVDQTFKAITGVPDGLEDGDFKSALRAWEKAEVQLNLVYRRNVALREKPEDISNTAAKAHAQIAPKQIARAENLRRIAAEMQVTNIGNAVRMFEVDVGRVPTNDEGIHALMEAPGNAKGWKGPYMEHEIKEDPWGHPYIYKQPGTHNPNGFDIYSMSPKGADGDENDIGNWQVTK